MCDRLITEMRALKTSTKELTYKGTIIEFTPSTEQDVKTLETILASNDLARLSEVSEWEVVEEGEKVIDTISSTQIARVSIFWASEKLQIMTIFMMETLRIISLIISKCTMTPRQQ